MIILETSKLKPVFGGKMQDYYPMLADTASMFLFLGTELSVLFIIISAAVSLLQQYISDAKIQALLSGSHGRGYFLASLLGAITPFCSCSTIPMLRGLLKAKAGFGPTLTFLFASPLLNPIILGLFVATFGLRVSIIYTCIALFTSIVAGIILNKMKFDKYIIYEDSNKVTTNCCSSSAKKQVINNEQSCCATENTLQPKPLQPMTLQPFPVQQASCCAEQASTIQSSSCCSSSGESTSSCCASSTPTKAENLTLVQRVKLAFADALSQFKQLFPYLLLGVSLGAFVYGFVPSDFIAQYASGDSIFAVPVAAVIGIPLYVRVEALIPLSAILVGKGMGLGAVMALIIGGGGASITEVILLKSMFRTPMIIAFLVVILGMAILAGYLFQFVL